MQSHRVLVVDDYADSAELLCVVLQTLGYEARAAFTGSAALDVALEFRPDIVILDLELPDMTGYEIARTLRERQDGHSLHLIALTGNTRADALAHASEAGFDQYVVKPLGMARIVRLMTHAAVQARSAQGDPRLETSGP
ncbi:MAG: hybrid sensor histidine kinase/response regulator [Deltaproteobacteria bacterium]|nr:hybrid sensor histidine kinase/response regulator [Deltaproteobacteria bacterium]